MPPSRGVWDVGDTFRPFRLVSLEGAGGVVDKLEDVWTVRDFPVLVEVTRLTDRGGSMIDPDGIMRGTGIDTPDVIRALHALERRGLVKLLKGIGGNAIVVDVSGDAYFLTGLHPSGDDAVSALVEALRQAADLQADPAEKSRLRTLADSALGVSRDVLGGVLVNLATKGMLG